jgi:hypothetical protein
MANAAYCREEARRCIAYAESAKDPSVRRRWHQLADDYITLAEQIDAGNADPSQGEFQHQPIQQQQGKRRG